MKDFNLREAFPELSLLAFMIPQSHLTPYQSYLQTR